jgi:hypothetical protein
VRATGFAMTIQSLGGEHTPGAGLRRRDPKPPGHLVIEKSFPLPIGLHPFTIDDKLWNGSLAGLADHFVGSTGRRLYVNFEVGNLVFVEEPLGFATIGTPE